MFSRSTHTHLTRLRLHSDSNCIELFNSITGTYIRTIDLAYPTPPIVDACASVTQSPRPRGLALSADRDIAGACDVWRCM